MTKQTLNIKYYFLFVIVSSSILAVTFYQLFEVINVSIVFSMSVDETQCFTRPPQQTSASSFSNSSFKRQLLGFFFNVL